MCVSFLEPNLATSFKIAECNCDPMLSQLDSGRRLRQESVLRRSSSCPWFIIFLLLSQPLRGSQANCYRAGRKAVAWRDAGRSREAPSVLYWTISSPNWHWEQQAATQSTWKSYEENLDGNWSKAWIWSHLWCVFFLQMYFYFHCYFPTYSLWQKLPFLRGIQTLCLCKRDSRGTLQNVIPHYLYWIGISLTVTFLPCVSCIICC